MKTEALKQALDLHGFDAAIGGRAATRSRRAPRSAIFSLRSACHRWDPRGQRPELWHLYNGRLNPGESIRVFPLSNWTELDIWTYIARENIPVVPLYFAAGRMVVQRDGMLILRDDERLTLLPKEAPELRWVRLPHARLLSADRRHRVARRHRRRDHRRASPARAPPSARAAPSTTARARWSARRSKATSDGRRS